MSKLAITLRGIVVLIFAISFLVAIAYLAFTWSVVETRLSLIFSVISSWAGLMVAYWVYVDAGEMATFRDKVEDLLKRLSKIEAQQKKSEELSDKE